jgi:hypothetical protein
MEFREIDSAPIVGKVEVGDFYRYPPRGRWGESGFEGGFPAPLSGEAGG